MVHTITRKAFTTKEKFETTTGETEMGNKATIPYGLYRAHGFFSPGFAEKTGFGPSDLDLLWRALRMMWDLDRSATRGLVATRGLYVFTHGSKLGDAPAHELFDRVGVRLRMVLTFPAPSGTTRSQLTNRISMVSRSPASSDKVDERRTERCTDR